MKDELMNKPKGAFWDKAMSCFGDYFKEKGLCLEDVPFAIVVHEFIGAAFAAAMWGVRAVGAA